MTDLSITSNNSNFTTGKIVLIFACGVMKENVMVDVVRVVDAEDKGWMEADDFTEGRS